MGGDTHAGTGSAGGAQSSNLWSCGRRNQSDVLAADNTPMALSGECLSVSEKRVLTSCKRTCVADRQAMSDDRVNTYE